MQGERQPAAGLIGLVLGLLAGCATPGPLHLYTARTAAAGIVQDQGPDAAVEIASFLLPDEALTGFAYDPFADHLFLRLTPGNRIRVIDRPARAIKREFTAARLPAAGDGGDLAVRPRDGHIFAAHPREPGLLEMTRFGDYVRTIPLAGLLAPPNAVAYDRRKDRFLLLRVRNHGTWLSIHESDGSQVSDFELAAPTANGSAGFDEVKRELYVPLADGRSIGVFTEKGRLVRTLAHTAVFLDVGPRSFVRVF